MIYPFDAPVEWECKFCGEWQDARHFYASDKNKCKDCVRETVRLNRERNAEYYKAFYRDRDKNPERVAMRKAYLQTEAGKKAHNAATKRYVEANPKKRAAHNAVKNALRNGTLIPWPRCAIPDCEEPPQAHHPDYDRPLDVVWLCPRHHTDAHDLISWQGLT